MNRHNQGSKNEKNDSLFFIFVDQFRKIIRCFLFSLIFQRIQRINKNQRNEINESTVVEISTNQKNQRIQRKISTNLDSLKILSSEIRFKIN